MALPESQSRVQELLHLTPIERARQLHGYKNQIIYLLHEVGAFAPRIQQIYAREESKRDTKKNDFGRALIIRPNAATLVDQKLLEQLEANAVYIIGQLSTFAYHPYTLYETYDELPTVSEPKPHKIASTTYKGQLANTVWFYSAEELLAANEDAFNTFNDAIHTSYALFQKQLPIPVDNT